MENNCTFNPDHQRVPVCGLSVARCLYDFIDKEVLPGLQGIERNNLWRGFARLLDELIPENQALLERRDALQQRIDAWYRERRENGLPVNCSGNNSDTFRADYRQFLESIGYLQQEPADVMITTENVDPEIATIAGPQLVVPVDNARYALNAANARWGSLYDALYGTDAIPGSAGLERGTRFNERRGLAVIETSLRFLDESIPLAEGSFLDVTGFQLSDHLDTRQLTLSLADGKTTTLAEPAKFKAFREEPEQRVLLFENNRLHIELSINPSHPVGALHPSGIRDVVLESAITVIQDCEDSVAAVDAADKVGVYRNWLGLMRKDLSATFSKQGKSVERQLNPDRHYTDPCGQPLTLPGRSLMLVRHVGHLMTTDAVLTAQGEPVPEGILDALVTSLIALHDLNATTQQRNSRQGSIYVVKPKMHGPGEVAFCVRLFSEIEKLLTIPHNTLKIGIMDEERRTTVNLSACIREARERLIFINTGFLDRTGDEIHTAMEAGPFLPKAQIKQQAWINAYETWNVMTGLVCGLKGKAQIGKGMWAIPDQMAQMLQEKQAHPAAGASCAWVPSPTAATLHALHYHRVDVAAVQSQLLSRWQSDRKEQRQRLLDDILSVPLMNRATPGQTPDANAIRNELENNAQGILGYVVRWIDQGIGCSKVPDIHHVGLMEDRATLRIASQLIANWLHHGICDREQVLDTFKRMARIVDEQNSNDPLYRPMAPGFDGIAFNAALALVFEGRQQPNGYTEPLLHAFRTRRKEQLRNENTESSTPNQHHNNVN